MDDILASIRKILNEDEAQPTPEPPGEAAGAAGPADDAMDLTADMMIAPPPVAVADMAPDPAAPSVAAPPVAAPSVAAPSVAAPAELAPPGLVPLSVAPPQPAPHLVDMAFEFPPVSPPGAAPSSLVSPPAAAAAVASLGQLSRAVAQDRAASVSRTMGLSIEDVVREEVRPLLKEWLDTHLPPLVERLVRAEIERVMSRAG